MNETTEKIDNLIPYSRNAKKHDTKQISRVAESIKQFGFVQPIVISKNNEIVIGHCRYEAAKILGLKEVPIIRVENLTDEEVKALRLADNKLNESEWDMKLAIDELKELSEEMQVLTGFDRDLIMLDELQDSDFERYRIITIEPPESPKLKERICIRCENIDDYQKIKKTIKNNGSEVIDSLLNL